ncbi:unnamed protein product, partial [Rotaria magnacalcarata]
FIIYRLICIKQYFQLVELIITVQCKREQYIDNINSGKNIFKTNEWLYK